MIYPHFIEVTTEDDLKMGVNIDNIVYYGDKIIWTSDANGFPVQESYDEIEQLLIDAGINITKADPRLDTTHPLTWKELTSVDMIGQPVWNSYTRKWMLVIDSDNLKAWVDLANHSGGTERWIEHDAQKYPLYRMAKP